MKNPNKIAACLLAALLLCAPAGCRLAQEEESEQAGKGRLAGVFVTTEHLDLFDYDSFLRDNIGSIIGGEAVVENTGQYQGRLYATQKKKTLRNEVTGETVESNEYAFEGLRGIPYFYLHFPAKEEGKGGYSTSVADDAICDGQISMHESDDGSALSLEATLYVTPNGIRNPFFINPVYQSADGRVYVTSGSGFSVGGMQPEGCRYSRTYDETYTVTENGKVKTDKVSVKISLSIMHPPEKIVLLQMDANGAAVSCAEYAPGALPKAIAPENGAEYIIVETCKTDGEGKEQVSRELYGKDAERLATFYCREDGICVKRWTQLLWR